MTVLELHYDFDIKIDKVDSESSASFNRAEKDWLLNEAQQFIVRRLFKDFELSQKRIDDLKTLNVVNEIQTPTLLADPAIYEFDLADLNETYMFFISGRADITKANCSGTTIASLKHIQHDDLNAVLDDPFNNSNEEELVYNFGRSSDGTSSSIYIYPNNVTVNKLYLNYIKQPNRINYGGYAYIDTVTYPAATSELPNHLHPEIVDVAVKIAAGIIQHPTYYQLKDKKVFENLNI